VLIAEVAGALLSNSLALLADAGHVLVDLASLGLSLFAMRLAERPATPRKTYGYRHAETIAAFLNALTVMALSVWIVGEALLRLRSPQPVRGGLMLAATLAGLAGNVVAAALLYRGQSSSINLRGAFLHIVGDILGSLAALVAAAGIFLLGTTVLDPIASIVVSVLLLTSGWELLRHSSSLLMLSVPPHLSVAEVERALLEIPSVCRVHDLHVWSVGQDAVVLSCHLVVDEPVNREQLLAAGQQVLRERFAIAHSVFQIESGAVSCPAEVSCFVPWVE
jgi:cobalt-zinc-cadmium efflux system protein